jgi:hypothetical protein
MTTKCVLFRAFEACAVETLMARPNVKEIGWRQLLEMLGSDDARVTVVWNMRRLGIHPLLATGGGDRGECLFTPTGLREYLDVSIGMLPAFEPYRLAATIHMSKGDYLQVTVPEGWNVELGPPCSALRREP